VSVGMGYVMYFWASEGREREIVAL
jgi:hypothetical protein